MNPRNSLLLTDPRLRTFSVTGDAGPAGGASTPSVQTGAAVQGGNGDGQGQQEAEQSFDLYDLDSVPAELRPFLEPRLKEIESNVGSKLKQAAEFRNRWTPYEELGLADVAVEDVSSLLRFYELLQDDDQFDEWLETIAKDRGILSDPQAAPREEEQTDFGNPIDEERLVALLEEKLEERLSPIEEANQAQAQEQAVAAAQQHVASELEALKEEHGPFDTDVVLRLAYSFGDDPQAIRKAHELMLKMGGAAQAQLVEAGSQQPNGAVQGGAPAQGFTPPRNMEEAKQAALARLAAQSG